MILVLTCAAFFLSDAAYAISAPLRWDSKALLVAGATASVGAGLFLAIPMNGLGMIAPQSLRMRTLPDARAPELARPGCFSYNMIVKEV